MRILLKSFLAQFRWMLGVTFMWATVYLPSAQANCNALNRSVVGFKTENWTTPTLPAGTTRQEIANITLTVNMTNCQSSGGDYLFGPVMRQFSNAGQTAFDAISSTFNNGVLKGFYNQTNRPAFTIEATASFSNFKPSSCKPAITATTFSGDGAPAIKFTNKPASPCSSFRYTGTIVVVQTADVVWGDTYSKGCTNPDSCLLRFWVYSQLWTGLNSPGGGTNVLRYFSDSERLEVWGKFPPIPPPPPTKKCVVQLQSAPTRSRL
jgi:hypothetical protein